MKSGLLLLLGALAALLGAAWAIKYDQDELLWTKLQWSEYKLDFPYSIFKTEEKNIASVKERLLGGEFVDHSLNGPQTDLQQLIEDDTNRGKFQPSTFAVTTLGADTPVEGAIAVVQCKVCISLVSMIWDHLIAWTHVAAKEATPADVTALGAALCDVEVPVGVLKDWAIMHAQVNHLTQVDGKVSGPSEFYMLSKRHRQHATEREIQATRMACRAVLAAADGENTQGHSQLSVAASLAQVKYLTALKERLGASAPVPASNAIAPPTPQRVCVNKHPQCEYWASLGECTANPVYMVGTSKGGWCRKACKECSPPVVSIPSSWSDDDVAALNGTSSHLLDFLHDNSCIKAASCRWTESTSAKGALAAAAGVDVKRTAILNQASIVAGPVTEGKTETQSHASVDKDPPTATVDSSLLLESIVKDTRASDAAIIPIGKEKREAKISTSPSTGASAVERCLWNVLGNTCMYLTTGWWSYEMCYYGSTTQYHVEDTASEHPDWVISLGHFAAAEWSPLVATDASLYPSGSKVPYIEHALVDGNVCMLTGEDGVSMNNHHTKDDAAGGTQSTGEGDIGDVVRRSTSLRFMCSPDSQSHMVVTEPKQCRYIVEVYLRELCGEAGMDVELLGSSAKKVGGSDGDDDLVEDQYIELDYEMELEIDDGESEDGYMEYGVDGEEEVEQKVDVKDEL